MEVTYSFQNVDSLTLFFIIFSILYEYHNIKNFIIFITSVKKMLITEVIIKINIFFVV